MLLHIVLIPAALGLIALIVRKRPLGRLLLIAGSIAHGISVFLLALHRNGIPFNEWIGLDATGLLFLSIASILFAAVSFYTILYLSREADQIIQDAVEGFSFVNHPESIFIGCLLLFLSAMSLVCISRNFGLLWVAVEATTLASAPLISFHKHHRSLEATWKYLLICSVGIALALLGNFFLSYAGSGQLHLNVEELTSHAKLLNPLWLKASFIMFLVGYVTKMGLAPMHNWLPDAHSEAPSMVSTLLSGALLNCAFLGILRGHGVLVAAGLRIFSGELLIYFGLLSMAIAAVFIIHQPDYKRMLAYSSIEHMGILSLGIGIGGLAGTGAMLHATCHSLTKGMLFLCSGQLLYIFKTKNAADVQHAFKTLPVTGFLWFAGFLAITGSPPFGLFTSELVIFKGIIENGRWYIAGFYLLFLFIIFIAMAKIVIPMTFGQADQTVELKAKPNDFKEQIWFSGPAAALCAGVLILGLYIPSWLWHLMDQAAQCAGGH
ncbi:MAG: NADH dehydrogenase FAD-containing subunit [Acidobacteria bacterium CG_4_9_14_3_um_filter_49_7]|nr:MAG: NADH dehydrogenase FAD-containing subunit [Acidobacteria bacterium CG_4_9_14_3_um_filter_49_7]